MRENNLCLIAKKQELNRKNNQKSSSGRIQKILFCGLFLILPFQHSFSQDLLEVNNKPFFASGMNLAWMNFGYDLTSFNASLFTKKCDSLAAAGGNSLRWWLHVNGTGSPQFTNDTVSGILANNITNLKKALDTAYSRNIHLILCLWSFDMLQSNAGNGIARNKRLIEDSIATAAYIRNALTPMVTALKGHPAILCWEVCNEPEGMTSEFGWSTQKTTIKAIQAWTNRIAGAIHRIDPGAKVSNGSWNIKVLTDVDGKYNYYRDDRLIAAGKDSLGTLDFYMVHYYTQYSGTSESPFHNPKSYWKLDKPLVIGEFSALGVYGGQISSSLSPVEAYNYAYNNGYAGALSWTMTNHDGNGGLPDAALALENLVLHHADTLQIDTTKFNFSPTFLSKPQDTLISQRNHFSIQIPLQKIAKDREDKALDFSITNSNNSILTANLTNDSIIDVFPDNTQFGIATITVKATDSKGKSATTYFNISLYDSTSSNYALYRKVKASSFYTTYYPHLSIDGDYTSYWWTYGKTEWILLELEKPRTFNKIQLNWTANYAKKYTIEVSNDNTNWQTIVNELNGKKGLNTNVFDVVTAKFIRINCLTRVTNNGFALNELAVFNDTTLALKNKAITGIIIYPNPAHGILNIKLTQEYSNLPVSAYLFNSLGQLVKTFKITSQQSQIKLTNLSTGLYQLHITTNENRNTYSVMIE
jgi:hypothetical protein